MNGETVSSESLDLNEKIESPRYVRVSLAAAITLGIVPGRFYRDAKLHCINILLTYRDGCIGRCAYCGLSKNRTTEKPLDENSFIRVNWPVIALDDILSRIGRVVRLHVERACVSMITNSRANADTLSIVDKLHKKIDLISVLVAPGIIDKSWLNHLKENGTDMIGVAIDAATPELFEKLRGRGAESSHKWETYWKTVKEAVEVFGRNKVSVHFIVGLGEMDREIIQAIQEAYVIGAQTHLFSFFPEKASLMQNCSQPSIKRYRRIQLANYLINHDNTSIKEMRFDKKGQLRDYGVNRTILDTAIESGLPFTTSGCPGKTMENACNRPFANCTPYQAYIGELRNYPFQPSKSDIKGLKKQLHPLTY